MAMELDAAVQAHGAFPSTAGVQSLIPYLEAVQRRLNDAGERVHKDLISMLDDARVRDFAMLLTFDNKRYYFAIGSDKPPQPNPLRDGEWVVHYFADSQQKLKRGSLPLLAIVNPQRGATFDWTSPQRRFYEQASVALDLLNDSNWEATFLELLRTLGSEPEPGPATSRVMVREMEPTLRLHLTRQVLELGCLSSHCLALGFKPRLDLLSKAQVDIEANWIDPDDELGRKARQSASDMLDRLSRVATVAECRKAAGGYYRQLEPRSRGPRYAWVGCLLRDDHGEWTANTPLLAGSAAGPLVVLRKDSTGAVMALPVGRAEAGKAALDRAAVEALTEGRPIFLVHE
jgi:hypothetical protein